MCLAAEKVDQFPAGVHSPTGVAFLAGVEVSDLPEMAIFTEHFSEVTAFVHTSKEGYYMTTLNECSCPDWRFRKAGTGQLCKHQKRLAAALDRKAKKDQPVLPKGVKGMSAEDLEERRARIAERNRKRAAEPSPVEKPFRGFNPPEDLAYGRDRREEGA